MSDSLRFLTAGGLRAPAWSMCPGAKGYINVPMAVGVMRRGDGRYVLVDAGFAAPELATPVRALGVPGLLFKFSGVVRDLLPPRPLTIAEQMKALGIDPGLVVQIVATHLHLDHIGGFIDFPNAEVLATPAEIAASRTQGRFAGYSHDKALRQSGRLVPLELSGGERHGFPAHRDLNDDGRVVVLDANGHTAGHVAVLLTDGDRSVLHAGDAAYSTTEYREDRQSVFSRYASFRRDWLRATWGRLRDFEAGGGEILLAHDPIAFARWGGATLNRARPSEGPATH